MSLAYKQGREHAYYGIKPIALFDIEYASGYLDELEANA